jgi:hypothetical protein
MPKFLIAVSSCQDDMNHGDHDVIRETWGDVAQRSGVGYIIQVGGYKTPGHLVDMHSHEYKTDLSDNWLGLPQKTIENCKFALDGGYDFMFQCFRDTYISVPRLVKAFDDIQDQQVVGNCYFHGVWEGYPCGGSGYWMRADFMQRLVTVGTNNHTSEDIMVGDVMKRSGVVPYHDSRYDHCSMRGGVSLHNSNITNHLWTNYNQYFQRVLGIHNWDSDWLRQEQRKELTGEWTEQDRAYMARIPQIKKGQGFIE